MMRLAEAALIDLFKRSARLAKANGGELECEAAGQLLCDWALSIGIDPAKPPGDAQIMHLLSRHILEGEQPASPQERGCA